MGFSEFCDILRTFNFCPKSHLKGPHSENSRTGSRGVPGSCASRGRRRRQHWGRGLRGGVRETVRWRAGTHSACHNRCCHRRAAQQKRENHEEDLIGKATGSLARPRGAASTGKGDTLAVESNTGSFECLRFCHEAKEANKPKHAQAPLSQNYSIKLYQRNQNF